MICPGGQILLSRRLPGTGQRLSASPTTTIRLSMLCTVMTVTKNTKIIVYYYNKRIIFNKVYKKGKKTYFKEDKKREYSLLF